MPRNGHGANSYQLAPEFETINDLYVIILMVISILPTYIIFNWMMSNILYTSLFSLIQIFLPVSVRESLAVRMDYRAYS